MKIKDYDDFINESEDVKTNKELKEFELIHISGDRFQVKSDDLVKEFSVNPYKDALRNELRAIFNRLLDAIEEESVTKLYRRITDAEHIDYDYGNLFSSKFSLMIVPEININLTEEQTQTLKFNELDFLKRYFHQLNNGIKNDILDELMDRAQLLCVSIEALFYYIRSIDDDNFYNGKAVDEIVEEYEEEIRKASKEVSFSFDGPSASPDVIKSIDEESEKAYWLCEKDLKKFVIFGTIAIKDLKAEDNIGGTAGLKLSVSIPNDVSSEDDYNFFRLNELPDRVRSFFNETLQK